MGTERRARCSAALAYPGSHRATPRHQPLSRAWLWPLPIATPPMYQLIAYKGTANGWAPIGRPRPFADACRLMRAAKKVNGDVWSYKLRCISPALPTFI
jgi:hypothetical protein